MCFCHSSRQWIPTITYPTTSERHYPPWLCPFLFAQPKDERHEKSR